MPLSSSVIHFSEFTFRESTFYNCDKTHEANYFKGEKMYFGIWFQSIATWPYCFGLAVAQYILSGIYDGRLLFTSPQGCRVGEELGYSIPFKGMPLMTKSSPTRLHSLELTLSPNSVFSLVTKP